MPKASGLLVSNFWNNKKDFSHCFICDVLQRMIVFSEQLILIRHGEPPWLSSGSSMCLHTCADHRFHTFTRFHCGQVQNQLFFSPVILCDTVTSEFILCLVGIKVDMSLVLKCNLKNMFQRLSCRLTPQPPQSFYVKESENQFSLSVSFFRVMIRHKQTIIFQNSFS